MTYEKTILDNGLVLLTVPVPYVRSVCVCIFVAVGSRYESDAEAGTSHFLEHMFFKGSAKWPSARAISEAVEGVGGLINASTGRETTMFWLKAAQPHARLAIDVLADMLMHPLLDEAEIEKERQVVIEEINMMYDSPETLVQILTDALVWMGQPLGREICGTKETVSTFTRESLVAFLRRHYDPAHTVVSVAGAIDPQEIRDMVAEDFGEWQPAPDTPVTPYQDEQTAPRVNVFYKETEQAHISLALPAISRNHPDRFVLSMANTILGDGMSSRLFQEIRERQALAYSVDSSVSFLQDTGVLSIYAGADPSRAARALDAILAELARLRDEPVTEEELRRALEFNRGRLLLQMENTSAVAAWYGRQEILPGKVYTVDEVIALLEQVTTEDIQRVARGLFHPTKLNLAVVGPFKSPELFSERLRLP